MTFNDDYKSKQNFQYKCILWLEKAKRAGNCRFLHFLR